MKTDRLLRRSEVAHYLLENWGLSYTTNTLAKLSTLGRGPVFRRANRNPLYAPKDLDIWASSILGPRMKSTSQLAEQQKTEDEAVS
jgi:hypothetical protein